MSFWEFIIKLFNHVFPPLDYVDVFLFIAFMAATIYGLRKISPALSVYNLAFLGMFFSRSIENVLLPSFMRYVLPIFPFFLVLSKLISRDWAKYLVISIFLAMQLILVFFFVNWLGVA